MIVSSLLRCHLTNVLRSIPGRGNSIIKITHKNAFCTITFSSINNPKHVAAMGKCMVAMGKYMVAMGKYMVAMGKCMVAVGKCMIAMGKCIVATGIVL